MWLGTINIDSSLISILKLRTPISSPLLVWALFGHYDWALFGHYLGTIWALVPGGTSERPPATRTGRRPPGAAAGCRPTGRPASWSTGRRPPAAGWAPGGGIPAGTPPTASCPGSRPGLGQDHDCLGSRSGALAGGFFMRIARWKVGLPWNTVPPWKRRVHEP